MPTWFQSWQEECGFPRFHNCKAQLQFQVDFTPIGNKTQALIKRLGHIDIQKTLNIYGPLFIQKIVKQL